MPNIKKAIRNGEDYFLPQEQIYIPNKYTWLYAPLKGDIIDRGKFKLPGWMRSTNVTPKYVENNGSDCAILWDYNGIEPTGGLMPPLSMTVWARAIGSGFGGFGVLLGYYNGTMKTMYSLLFSVDYTQVAMSYLQELIAWNNVYYTVDTSKWHCYGMATDGPNAYLYVDGVQVASTNSRPTTGGPDGSNSYVGVLNRGGGDVCNGEAGGAIIETRLNDAQWFKKYYDKTKDFYVALNPVT